MSRVDIPEDEMPDSLKRLLGAMLGDEKDAEKYAPLLFQLFDVRVEYQRAHLRYEIELHTTGSEPDPDQHLERAYQELKYLPPKIEKTAEEMIGDSGLHEYGFYTLLGQAETDGVLARVEGGDSDGREAYRLTQKGDNLAFTYFSRLPMALRKYVLGQE